MGSPQAHACRVAPGYDSSVIPPPYVEGVERAGSLPALLMLEAQATLFPCACCAEVARPACGAGDTFPLCRPLGREKGGWVCVPFTHPPSDSF